MVQSLSTGSSALQWLKDTYKLDADSVDSLMVQLSEQLDDVAEVDDALAQPINGSAADVIDDDELLAELAALEDEQNTTQTQTGVGTTSKATSLDEAPSVGQKLDAVAKEPKTVEPKKVVLA